MKIYLLFYYIIILSHKKIVTYNFIGQKSGFWSMAAKKKSKYLGTKNECIHLGILYNYIYVFPNRLLRQ